MTTPRSLDDQRREFAARRFLAMPLAGTIAWVVVGLAGMLGSEKVSILTLFVATGSIAYLGIALSRFTGEHFLAKDRPANSFDRLFFLTVGMCLLVYAIAIPFFMIERSSLPLTVGVLTGLMWLPMTWILEHPVGLVHGVARTLLVTAAWYLFPTQRYTVIPAVIVAVYAVTIVVLERRWRSLGGGSGASVPAAAATTAA